MSYVIQIYKVNDTCIKLYRWSKLNNQNNTISYYTIVYHTRRIYIYIKIIICANCNIATNPPNKFQKVRMLTCIITPNQKCSKALLHSYDGILISWLVKIGLMYSTLLGSSSLPPCPRKYCLHKQNYLLVEPPPSKKKEIATLMMVSSISQGTTICIWDTYMLQYILVYIVKPLFQSGLIKVM